MVVSSYASIRHVQYSYSVWWYRPTRAYAMSGAHIVYGGIVLREHTPCPVLTWRMMLCLRVRSHTKQWHSVRCYRPTSSRCGAQHWRAYAALAARCA
eukprot:3169257-Rhodomonas_salina.1